MTPEAWTRCICCREAREPEDLLLVTVRGQPDDVVCRPILSGGTCFRGVTGSRARQRISVLADYLAQVEK